jgi:hypothetical protein
MTMDIARAYMQRAFEMRAQAGRAETEYLRRSYLAIAKDWERAATEVAAKLAPKAKPSNDG